MKKFLLFVGVCAVFVLAFSGVALASSSHDICQDYIEHRTFTHQYSFGDLRTCLSDAACYQYCGREHWAEFCAYIRWLLSHGWPCTTTTTAHTTTTCRPTTTYRTTTTCRSGGYGGYSGYGGYGGYGGYQGATTSSGSTTTTTTTSWAYGSSGVGAQQGFGGTTLWPFAIIGLIALPGLGGAGSWLRRQRRKPKI